MARTYYTDFEVPDIEGNSFDSHLARVGIVDNLEAMYETVEFDITTIFSEWFTCDTTNSRHYVGPFFIPARKDRDGLYRDIKITPLCIGGTDQRDLYVTMQRSVKAPVEGIFQGYTQSWVVPSGTTVVWDSEETITPWRANAPNSMGAPRDTAVGREVGRVTWWTVLFEWLTITGANPPRFAGVRFRESITT